MLEMRTRCERCGATLDGESRDAWICSYECTFCNACADTMQGQCPNCGGVLCARPPRVRKQALGEAVSAPAGTAFPTADDYAAERALFDALTVIDLRDRQSRTTARYHNEVLADINGDCLRLSVFQEAYRWHCHPGSDELFLVIDGILEIDLSDRTVRLAPWQMIVIPAGVVHRTRAVGRTANVTFEKQAAGTVFLEGPDGRDA